MISVRNLTKKFAGTVAVNDVSFEVEAGEVVGFCGPNGAGKSTTMRILSGFLAATGGDVEVAGFDVFKQSLEVRRQVGYLPEHLAIYPEMRVDEYLRYRAKLKGVARKRIRPRLEEVKELCGLASVGRKIIGHLSKGYKQRVGLADALMHSPPLLILDEPTLGLDPNQIRQIRTLIKDLASKHTVILSSHILPEVEMTCQRLLVINQGKIVASDTPQALCGAAAQGNQIVAELRGGEKEIEKVFGKLLHVKKARAKREGDWVCLTLDCEPEKDLRPDVFELAVQHGWMLRELRKEKKSLEDIFVSLTHGDGS